MRDKPRYLTWVSLSNDVQLRKVFERRCLIGGENNKDYLFTTRCVLKSVFLQGG